MNKVDYVLKQRRNPSNHHCHWPGCDVAVPPAMWGCKRHWFTLPQYLRNKIWLTYVPGQEITKTPSAEYVAVAEEIQAWIKAKGTQ